MKYWFSILAITVILLLVTACSTPVSPPPPQISPPVSEPSPAPSPSPPVSPPATTPADKSRAHFAQGNIHIEKEQWTDAIAEFSKAIEANPRLAEAYANRAVAHSKTNDHDLAIADVETAIKLDPLIRLDLVVAQAYQDRGIKFLKDDKYEQAINDLTKAISIDSKDAFTYAFRAKAYDYLDKYDRAIADYTKAIQLAPEFALADFYADRGWVYFGKGQYPLAILDFTKAIELRPDDAEGYSGRGTALFANGHQNSVEGAFQLAIADLTTAIRLNPRDAADYTYRGWAYSKLGDYDKAIADYTQSIKLDPDADIYNRRGFCYAQKGERDRAIADYTKAIELDPEYEAAYYNRGMSYRDLGMDAEAVADFKKFIALAPNSPLVTDIQKYITELSQIITDLAYIKVSAWEYTDDADPEGEGIRIYISFYDSKSEPITFQDIPVTAIIQLYSYSDFRDALRKIAPNLIYETKVSLDMIRGRFLGDEVLRIPFEQIPVYRIETRRFGSLKVTVTTPRQGSFQATADLVPLFP